MEISCPKAEELRAQTANAFTLKVPEMLLALQSHINKCAGLGLIAAEVEEEDLPSPHGAVLTLEEYKSYYQPAIRAWLETSDLTVYWGDGTKIYLRVSWAEKPLNRWRDE